ncbi:hypothetical protein CXU21_04165 [Akkermansia muciniphila]|nr:hypothetical protein CXU21_04165 [Akkermansia muciniphila]
MLTCFFMRLLLLFLLGMGAVYAGTLRGVVINVVDGDTVILLEKAPEGKRTHRVQLKGIDAPEYGQAGCKEAKAYLEKLVWGETVTVQYTGDDQYGRILGLVLCGVSRVNDEMVKEGWAWRYKKSTSRELAAYESEARAGKKGLWAEPNPISPWEWRGGKRPGEKGGGF